VLPTHRYVVAADRSVAVRVADLGMACCAVEFSAAVAQGLLISVEESGHGGAEPALGGSAVSPSTPVAMSILVVSGTVTQPLLPSVVAAWAKIPEPKAAMAFGACTITGGPYWDSYSVAPGIDSAIPIHRYVPGCPPRPEALIDALLAVAGSVR
jgi:NADH-quinone oxidoreductase subunit B